MNTDKLIEALGWATGEKPATAEQKAEAIAVYWEARIWQDKEREAEELYAESVQAEMEKRAQEQIRFPSVNVPFMQVAADICNPTPFSATTNLNHT